MQQVGLSHSEQHGMAEVHDSTSASNHAIQTMSPFSSSQAVRVSAPHVHSEQHNICLEVRHRHIQYLDKVLLLHPLPVMTERSAANNLTCGLATNHSCSLF